jgi:hypothetical protein
MGRGGSGITFGRIQVVSEGESLEKLYEVFNKIMKEHGYPESKVVSFDDIDGKDEGNVDGGLSDEDGVVIEDGDEKDDGADVERPEDVKKVEALKRVASAPWMRRKGG